LVQLQSKRNFFPDQNGMMGEYSNQAFKREKRGV